MGEIEVASVYTHLLLLDAVKLMWIPVSNDYIHVVLLYDQRQHSYRIVGEETILDCKLEISNEQYSKMTDLFHQLLDQGSNITFGFNFYSTDDAGAFMEAVMASIEDLKTPPPQPLVEETSTKGKVPPPPSGPPPISSFASNKNLTSSTNSIPLAPPFPGNAGNKQASPVQQRRRDTDNDDQPSPSASGGAASLLSAMIAKKAAVITGGSAPPSVVTNSGAGNNNSGDTPQQSRGGIPPAPPMPSPGISGKNVSAAPTPKPAVSQQKRLSSSNLNSNRNSTVSNSGSTSGGGGGDLMAEIQRRMNRRISGETQQPPVQEQSKSSTLKLPQKSLQQDQTKRASVNMAAATSPMKRDPSDGSRDEPGFISPPPALSASSSKTNTTVSSPVTSSFPQDMFADSNSNSLRKFKSSAPPPPPSSSTSNNNATTTLPTSTSKNDTSTVKKSTTNNSIGQASNASMDMDSFKRELLQEFRNELQIIKSEIVDEIISRLTRDKQKLKLLLNAAKRTYSTLMTYKTRQIGAANSLEYRLFIESAATGKLVSPFHDIPLFANAEKTVFNMVVEIPRWSNAKLEISKEQALNPIKQDVKKGKLRFVKNCFPYHGYIWNYGALPQTWEDPTHAHPDTGAVGDNDPIDVIEIGEAVAYSGQVKQVKALGVMALLDEGETDWKVIAIDVNDPLADKLNDVADVDKHFPGLLNATRDWFRIYKIPDGKPENQFAFNGEAKNKQYCLQVIQETHEAWQKLISAKIPNKTEKYDINTANTQVKESGKYLVDDKHEVYKSVPAATQLPAQPIDKSLDKWYFVSTL